MPPQDLFLKLFNLVMRLLKASTIELHEFVGERVPEYAILSHRWGEKEVSMQELRIMMPGAAHNSEGYRKIERACALAEQYGLGYIWIDTCCIDKTSSAELSEAINSMYRWYAKSVLCFAHLADIVLQPLLYKSPKNFMDSEWFQRGWTLQELLAPETVLFFDTDWQEIGTRMALTPYITKATGIGPEFLRQERDVHEANIAQRMSWASLRRTTRDEDIAYCLMGLFDVNMPLLYGEGNKAFLRLQKELISNNSDESIYAWKGSSWDNQLSGMLASEPRQFAHSGRIVPVELPGMRQTPFSMTNRGIAMTLPAEARIGGGFEIPMACANLEDIQAPLRLRIREDTNGSYGRDHDTNGSYGRDHAHDYLPFIPNLNASSLRMESLHVSLSSSYRYNRRRSKFLKSSSEYMMIQLRPAAQANLRLLGSIEEIGFVEEGPFSWRHELFRAHEQWWQEFVLDFQYKERRSIHLVFKGNKFALHVDDICKANGCKEYGNDESTTSVSGEKPSTMPDTVILGQEADVQGHKVTDSIGLSTTPGDPLWENCTFTEWEGCQSRPLNDGNFLWVSTRVLELWQSTLNPRGKQYVLDLDISSIDRLDLFTSRETLIDTDTIRTEAEKYLEDPEVKAEVHKAAKYLVERRRARVKADSVRWPKAFYGTWYQCQVQGCQRGQIESPDERAMSNHLSDKHAVLFADDADHSKLEKIVGDFGSRFIEV